MLDLSDYAWLIIVGVYFVVRAVSRLFRSKGGPAAPPAVPAKPERVPSDGRLEAPAEPAPERFGTDSGRDHRGGATVKPIEPR